MLKVGLTGNIGSGKSTVAELFKTLGIPVFHADNEAKLVLDEPAIIFQLLERLGNHIVDSASKKIDRKVLAGIIFNDQKSLDFVNALIHSNVRERWMTWVEAQQSQYVIEEAAILFESGHHKAFDKIVLVTAPQELRIKRVMDRDNIEREKVLERIKNQWPEQEKLALSDYIIKNDGIIELLPQVKTVHESLLKTANNNK
jgi:dephospho-CoA kinase